MCVIAIASMCGANNYRTRATITTRPDASYKNSTLYTATFALTLTSIIKARYHLSVKKNLLGTPR